MRSQTPEPRGWPASPAARPAAEIQPAPGCGHARRGPRAGAGRTAWWARSPADPKDPAVPPPAIPPQACAPLAEEVVGPKAGDAGEKSCRATAMNTEFGARLNLFQRWP